MRSQLTYSRIRIDGTSINVQIVFCQHFGTFVDGTARSVKNTAQHVFGNANLQVVAGEFDFRLVIASAYRPATLARCIPF